MTDYDDLVHWLRAQHKRHGEQEDADAADAIIALREQVAAKDIRFDAHTAVLQLRAERAEADNAALTAKLVRIYWFLGPEDVRLPDGRVMRFNNPTIEREMLRELSAAIRAMPAAAMREGKEGK